MNKLKRFQYWLGSPAGALWYFGICYTLIAVGIAYIYYLAR